MSNPTKIYNDYVRANLPSTMTFDSTTVRYDINNHSFFKFKKSNWYFKYITKFGYASLSAYAVNNFDPDLVFDFKQNYYRTGGTETTLSPAVTHTRAGNATMTDSDGKIKWAPHNLLIRSEELNLWSQLGTGSVVVDNAVAPDGTTTAATLTIGSTTALRYILSSATYTAGDKITYSFWARSDTVTSIGFGINGGASTGNNAIYANRAVTSTWSLLEFEFTILSSDASLYYIIGKQGDNPVNNQLGDIEIWHPHTYRSGLGGMVNNSATGNSYVPTTSSPVYAPRVGHHVYNGSAWVNEGVLHESEARTNRATNSNLFSSNNYTKNNISVTASSVTSPDGSNNGWKITPTGTNPYIRRGGSISGNFTHSLYVKKDTADYVVLGHGAGTKGLLINFSFASGTVVDTGAYGSSTTYISNTVENVDNGWYRISVTGNTGANNNLVTFPWDSATAPTNLDSSSNASSSTVYIYGAQTEVASTPSSYIPTSGSQVTRAAETLTVPAANLPYSSTNVSIQIDGKMTYADDGFDNTVLPWRWRLDSSNILYNTIATAGTRTGQPRFIQRQATSGYDEVIGANNVYSPNFNVPFNLAGRYGSTFINGAHEGTLLTANTTPTALPDLSSTNLELGYIFMGTIGKFRVWDEDLTDAGIEEAST